MNKKIDEIMFCTKSPEESINFYNTLNTVEKNNYLQLYQLYSNLLNAYMIKILDLRKYDETITTSSNKFKKINEEDMDLYQFLASDFLNYFYIRNNIYLERLSPEDINYLFNLLNTKQYELTDNTIEFIKRTYKLCVSETIGSNEFVNYGSDAVQFYRPINSLIIGFRFDDFYVEDNQADEMWNIMNDRRKEEVKNVFIQMQKELENKLDIPISIIQYDEFSVKKALDEKHL